MADLADRARVLIEAPIEVVWRTITEPDQMSRWFADRVDLVVEPGARGYMQFGDQGGPVVVETVDPRRASRSDGTIPPMRNRWPANRCPSSSHLTPEGDEPDATSCGREWPRTARLDRQGETALRR